MPLCNYEYSQVLNIGFSGSFLPNTSSENEDLKTSTLLLVPEGNIRGPATGPEALQLTTRYKRHDYHIYAN